MTTKQIKTRAKAALSAGRNHGNLLLGDVISGIVATILLIGTVCVPCVELGRRQLYLDAVNGQETNLKSLYGKFKKQFGSSFFLALCCVVLAAAAIAAVVFICIILNTIFSVFRSAFLDKVVIVIGIILGIVVCFYLIITETTAFHVQLREPEIDGAEALKKGWAIASRNPGAYLKLFFSFFGWWLLLLPTFGLVLIYLNPYYNLSETILLEQLYNGTSKEFLDKVAAESFKETAGSAASTFAATASATASVVGGAVTNAAEDFSKKVEEKKTENAAGDAAEFVFCPACGTKNPGNALFCEKCGTKIQ